MVCMKQFTIAEKNAGREGGREGVREGGGREEGGRERGRGRNIIIIIKKVVRED